VKLTLISEQAVRLEPNQGALTIDSISGEHTYSPFHMIGGALGYCTLSVLASWGAHAGLNTSDLTLEVSWTLGENPRRIDAFDVRFSWPSLPANRLEAARRAAELCAVHATLSHRPRIAIAPAAKASAGL